MTEAAPETPRLPPIWLLGMANLPYGFFGAVVLLTVPQLLAARHVPEAQIASVTAFALVPGFCGFLLAPMLDVRFSRRTYAVALAALSVVLLALGLQSLDDLPRLGGLLFAGYAAQILFTAAISGWLGSLVPTADDSRLGAWLNVSNISGFGVMAILGITLLRALPAVIGPIALGAIILAPTMLFLWLPAPGPDRRLAKESFGQLVGDLAHLVRMPAVLRTLPLFALPAASFALTNTLGGLGAEFGASEAVVGIAGGVGVVAAGIVGALLVPVLVKRVTPVQLYLLIGAVGALFTLSLIAMPRSPIVFVLAMTGENVFQAAAFATAFTIIFASMGKANPFAATHFALLNAANCLPIAYMQLIDGHAHGWRGATGSFLADGLFTLAACAALAIVLKVWRPEPSPAAVQLSA
ncbi:hypothetical protein BH09PSE2_BH09PSE2_01890 [soil metagenome]